MGANVKNILIGIQSKYTGRHVYLEHFHPDQIENTTPRNFTSRNKIAGQLIF